MSLSKTEPSGFEHNTDKKEMWYVGNWRFHNILECWFRYFNLHGNVLLVGHFPKFDIGVKTGISEEFSDIECIRSCDVQPDSDIVWDITRIPDTTVPTGWDFVICQSVLEHVIDPAASVRNMGGVLKDGGLMFISTHGPSAEYHPYPIDCFRFLKDIFTAWADAYHLTIEDILWTRKDCFVAYRK